MRDKKENNPDLGTRVTTFKDINNTTTKRCKVKKKTNNNIK